MFGLFAALFAYDRHFIFPGPATVIVYKCPSVGDAGIDAPWASIGCIGQVSLEPACNNIFFGHPPKPHDCNKIGALRYDTADK
jgi:hypothetical protein